VTVSFPDRETEKRASAYPLGRFPGRVLRSGDYRVSDEAAAALADQNIPFVVRGGDHPLSNRRKGLAASSHELPI
jgi:hypothetical protein